MDLAKARALLERPIALRMPAAIYQKAILLHQQGDTVGYARHLEQASQLGILPATYRLARCYARGIGVPRNDRLSGKLMAAAAAQGHLGAKMFIARKLLHDSSLISARVRGFGMLVAAFTKSVALALRAPWDDRLL